MFLEKYREKYHDVYKFLGVKFKVIRQLYKSVSVLRKEEYRQIYYAFRHHGYSEELLKHLKLLEQSLFNWKNLDQKTWILYINLLLEKGDLNEALTILKKYNFFYNLSHLNNFLRVANFAHDNGYTNEVIETSSKIYKQLIKNREDNVLEKVLKGKRIAIVGNGPSEVGKNKGKEIDEHDIVIRFNNFRIKGFEADYGTRTDIWCCNLNTDIKNRDLDFQMILLPEDVQRRTIRRLNIFSDAMEKDVCIYSFEEKYTKGLEAEFYDQPTFGLRLIYGLTKIFPDFGNIDFYGFNFCSDEMSEFTIHYFNERNFSFEQLHNLPKETEYLLSLIKKMKKQ